MKPKFQPTPKRINMPQKCSNSSPVNANTPATAIRIKPLAVMAVLPKRVMRCPVKKLGPNMASTCHWMPSAASPTVWPQPTMAIGAAVMMKDIKPYVTTPAITATMNRGSRAISPKGRAWLSTSSWRGAGMRSIKSSGMANRPSAAWPKKLPANGAVGSASRVQMTTCGPMTAAIRPPTMMREIARGRCGASTASDAAKR